MADFEDYDHPVAENTVDIEDEASFINPLDAGTATAAETAEVGWAVDNQNPSWAQSRDIPDTMTEDQVTTREATELLVKQWESMRSKIGIHANLQFSSSTRGDLWVKWGTRWVLLTYKHNPN